MNRNLTINYVLFLVLSFVIIFGYSYFFGKKKEEKVKQPVGAESAQQAKSPQQPVPAQPSVSTDDQRKSQYESLVKKDDGRIITVTTPLYVAMIDTRGGRVVNWNLKDYSETTQEDSPPVDLVNSDKQLITNVKIKGYDIPFLIPFTHSGPGNIEITDESKQIALTYTTGTGVKLTKTIQFQPDNYLISQSMVVSNQGGSPVDYRLGFQLFGKIEERGRGDSSDYLVALVNNELEKVTSLPKVPEQFTGQVDWFGLSDKYFLSAIVPELGVNSTIDYSAFNSGKLLNASYFYPGETIKAGNTSTTKWKSYLGPKEERNLQAAGYDLDLAIDYGWFGFLAKIAVDLLKLANSVLHNYGVSIIAITVILRVLFLPLTLKSMRSMKEMQNKMQDLKPKIDALKEKYKEDKQKQNAELMKLYTSHGVNPLSSLGGCFPLLLQLPVFIALYEALLYSIDLRHTPFLWINDLAEPEHLFNIPLFGDFDIPFRILPLAMGVSWFISQKMTPTSAPGSETMELQMKMMQFMPIIFTVMFWGLPSGLILYWTVSNILSIFQQLYINRTVHVAKGGA